MAVISLQDISLSLGGPLLFDNISLQLEPGERVALLGRNGTGKTTLMKVMARQLEVDTGKIIYQKGAEITHLPQEIPAEFKGDVFDIVLSGLGGQARTVSEYHHLSHRLQTEHTPALMRELDRLQAEMDRTNGWEIDRKVEQMVSQMRLDPDQPFENLSGGQKKRVMLARAFVLNPDILLLDEPTNHLDMDTINWLEEYLKQYRGTVFFVTHDRMFMTHLATRIVELDRGKIYSWMCDYKTFLERKQLELDIEASHHEHFDKKLAQEEVWIRKGIKARRTRNEGRVKALERLRVEKLAQRRQVGKVRMTAQEADISGRQVIKAVNISYGYDDVCLIDKFTTQIMRGDKIGLIGPNGSGKTTLLKILLGKLPPKQGTIKLGTNLEIAYYDQLRQQLNEEKSVIENISGGSGDTVMINGKPRHVISYLQDFLFSPDRARTPVKVLSGGERNRLFLARLFTQPFNFLVMDEPTNDLDIETLELLEELLIEYSGTLLLVSHDRAFLNNVVTSTIVFEGNGKIGEYPGGYDDWLNQKQYNIPSKYETGPAEDEPPAKIANKPGLTFEQQRELNSVTAKITKLEAQQDKIYNIMDDPEFYKQDKKKIQEYQAQLEKIEDELLAAFERWEYLEGLKEGTSD